LPSPPKFNLELGEMLTKRGGERVRTSDALSGKRRLGFYFAARPTATQFTGKLRVFFAAYSRLDPGFQVIFISGDADEAAALDHFNNEHGDWLMRPFNSDVFRRLRRELDLNDTHAFVIIDSDGRLCKRDAKQVVTDVPPKLTLAEELIRILDIDERVTVSSLAEGQSQLIEFLSPSQPGKVVGYSKWGEPVVEGKADRMAGVDRLLVQPVKKTFAGVEPSRAAPVELKNYPAELEEFKTHPRFQVLADLCGKDPAAFERILPAVAKADEKLGKVVLENKDAFKRMLLEAAKNST